MIHKYHKDGTLPNNGEIFVFGSNLAGIHGAGAAKVALNKFGARFGNGIGMSGQSYAIPTKSANGLSLDTLPLPAIQMYVANFIQDTWKIEYKDTHWFVTRIGCGLAGYADHQIAPMFRGARNCSFAQEWLEYLEDNMEK